MIHSFQTHLPQLTYITAQGRPVVITGTLLLDSTDHADLIKELTAVAEDPGSPIFIPATNSEVQVTAGEEATQKALTAELLEKAAKATAAAKKG